MPDILFLTLKVFSSTGGIEKVCRVAGKSLYEYAVEHNKSLHILSMYDGKEDAWDNRYFPSEIFTAYHISKVAFMKEALRSGRKSGIVILSHVNLLLAGWLIKKINPGVKILLLAHGIEIWDKMSPRRKRMIGCCDEIICVSAFTRDRILENGLASESCTVINNCLDPFLPLLKNVKIPLQLKKRYGFSDTDKILFTLTRLSAKERYKGYDKVMEAMLEIEDKTVKYLIAGSYDAEEKAFISKMIAANQLQDRVVLAGYISEEEVAAHFAMADCYVMPSVKEGFGIVFIEAMYYGSPVIAGNKDGSVDALRNGALGILVDPGNVREIRDSILSILETRDKYVTETDTLTAHFSYDVYKEQINSLLARQYDNPLFSKYGSTVKIA